MDDEWIQRNLPPAAAQRVRAQAAGRVAGSLLSAPAAAALASVDLVPAGEVMGCIVMHLGWTRATCGLVYSNTQGMVTPVVTSGQQGGGHSGAFPSYLAARKNAYGKALARMLAEATALGATGVVGVDLRWTRIDTESHELVALGTAVRNRNTPTTSVQPFATELSGEDVTKAALAGWTPLGIAIGLGTATKHEDYLIRWQRSQLTGPGNTEVDGLTRLIHAARAEARTSLTESGRLHAASGHEAGQIVVSSSNLRVGEQPCGEEVDFRAEATLIGTALTYDPRQVRQTSKGSLSILPLRGAATSSRLNSRPEGAPR